MLSRSVERRAELVERLKAVRVLFPRSAEGGGVIISDPEPAKFDRVRIHRYNSDADKRGTSVEETDVISH